MEQAHHLLFVIRRARLDYRADYDFEQSAADRVEHDGNEQTDKRRRQNIRQDGQRNKSRRREHMSRDSRRTVAYLIDKERGEQIDAKLENKIDGYQRSYL